MLLRNIWFLQANTLVLRSRALPSARPLQKFIHNLAPLGHIWPHLGSIWSFSRSRATFGPDRATFGHLKYLNHPDLVE